MRLLLHCCCGPCSLEVGDYFRSLGYEVTFWFSNPNIHPPEELARREAAMAAAVAARSSTSLLSALNSRCSVASDALAPRRLLDFLLHLSRHRGRRCRACYQLRLVSAACAAAAGGYDAFSTTLAISPYQDLQAIAEIGAQAGAEAGVRFAFADLRDHYHASAERARELALYRQKYCGCLFSALERESRRARRAIAKSLPRR